MNEEKMSITTRVFLSSTAGVFLGIFLIIVFLLYGWSLSSKNYLIISIITGIIGIGLLYFALYGNREAEE